MSVARDNAAEAVAREHDGGTEQGGMDAHKHHIGPQQEYLDHGAALRKHPRGQKRRQEREDDAEMQPRKGKEMGGSANAIGFPELTADGTALAKGDGSYDAILVSGHACCLERKQEVFALAVHIFFCLLYEGNGDSGFAAPLNAVTYKQYAKQKGSREKTQGGKETGKDKKCRQSQQHQRGGEKNKAIAPDKDAESYC